MYESCVAEVSDHGQCYLMTAEQQTGPTAESQWLHFLPLRAPGSHLLIYVYNTHADLFAVYTAKKNGANVRPSTYSTSAFYARLSSQYSPLIQKLTFKSV